LRFNVFNLLLLESSLFETQDPFNPNNNSNQASSEAVNNDPRLPPGFPKPLPPLDKDEIKQTDALIAVFINLILKRLVAL
jgi:hypothetical protein